VVEKWATSRDSGLFISAQGYPASHVPNLSGIHVLVSVRPIFALPVKDNSGNAAFFK